MYVCESFFVCVGVSAYCLVSILELPLVTPLLVQLACCISLQSKLKIFCQESSVTSHYSLKCYHLQHIAVYFSVLSQTLLGLQRLSALFRIHELTDACNWRVLL